MKRTKIIFAFTLLCSVAINTSKAQEDRGMALGITGGVTSVWMKYTESKFDYDPALALRPIAAIFFQMDLSENIFFKGEIAYKGKGGAIKEDLFEYHIRARYLEYSFIPAYRFPSGGVGKFSPYVFAGPYLSFPIGGDIEIATYKEVRHTELSYGNINAINYGVIAGIGTSYKYTDKYSFQLEIAKSHGLNNSFAEDEEDRIQGNLSVTNGTRNGGDQDFRLGKRHLRGYELKISLLRYF